MRWLTRYRDVLICVGLVAATAAVYWPVRHFGFVDFDDNDYVYRNAHLTGGLTAANLRWAFTTFDAANYHPLVWVSFLFDASAWGLRPGPMHVENVGLHAANAVLLFALFRRAAGGPDGAGPPSPWPAAVLAAVFALHPTHVESVAWVTERKDVLSTCFMLLAMLAYARYAGHAGGSGRAGGAGPRWYVAVLVAYAAALLSKQMPVTLGAILLLMDVWPLGRVGGPFEGRVGWGRAIVEKVPLVVMAAAVSAATVRAQRAGGAVSSLAGVPAYDRVANAAVAYARYLGSAVWPADLAAFYRLRRVSPAAFVAAFTAMAAVTAASVWVSRRARRPYVAVGWLWFAGSLVPVIGLVQVGAQSMADRYLYVPLIGLGIVAAWGTWDLGRATGRVAAVAVGWAGVLLALGVAARRQVGYWADTDHLQARVLSVEGAAGLVQLGENAVAKGDAAEAERQFRRAVAADPSDATAHFDLGNLMYGDGRPRQAFDEWARAADLDPTLADARYNMGVALAKAGQRAAAAAAFRDALRADPLHAAARRALASVTE